MYKKKITVLVAENKDENCPSALQQALAALPEVESAHLVTNGAKVQSEVRGLRPDVLLLDLVLPVLDGLEILKKLQTARLPKMPVIIVSTAISREAIIDEAIRLGAAYYLPKAAGAKWVARRTVEVYSIISSDGIVVAGKPVRNSELCRRIASRLNALGMPPNLKGYGLLKSALCHTVRDNSMLASLTKELYPLLAEENNTVPARVERVIRNAIEATWERGNIEAIHELFGYAVSEFRGRPTNAEFIARMTDDILLHL